MVKFGLRRKSSIIESELDITVYLIFRIINRMIHTNVLISFYIPQKLDDAIMQSLSKV